MFRYSKDRVSVSTVLDTRREKNGGFPVKIRVGYNRKQKYFPTSKVLSIEDWDKLPSSRNRALIEIREEIEASFNIIRVAVRAITDLGEFSFDDLILRLRGAATSTINIALRSRIEQMRKEERYGNMYVIESALSSFEKFAGNHISFASITPTWLRKYEQYMLDQNRSLTTISFYLCQLKVVFNEAKRLGIIKPSSDPFMFGRFTIRKGEGRKLALTLPQIKLLATYSGNATMEKYRDYWLFLYLCNGINVTDLVRLKYSNIQDGEICFVRQKTKRTTKTQKEIRAVITPQMWDIINKRGNKCSHNNYIFPILKGKESELQRDKISAGFTHLMNIYTRKLGRLLGIGNITTYTARHSFATVLKRSGANIAYISESLGHSSLSITENYLSSFEREEREKNALLLTNFD